MSGYRSDLNIRLGQMPEIKDNPQVFTELQQVYNAIHLLNAALNDVRRNFADVERDTPGWESFTFEGRSFWAPAANNVKAGDLVTMKGSQFVQGIKGHSEDTILSYRCIRWGRAVQTIRRVTSAVEFGMCLEDSSGGLAHIGWPAAIVEVSGIPVGELGYGRVTSSGDPKIYSNAPYDNYYPVGRVVAPNAILLQPNIMTTVEITRTVRDRDRCGSDGGGGGDGGN